ncbi:hypothetical protein CSA56_14460 [candidate division KSB3 bacterium]|uniref:Nitrogenase/oxidoreductase component 1 domain-containing protein n=1 Tax=candidate division KSB3 bacterium TaxID=2044937 RepID=A0A2G6KAI8_9BACT|nr:MAG: hypothetical protein CSA56_14460 [candidate division KSB3 bacterium]
MALKVFLRTLGTGKTENISPYSINILGEFNVSGEAWIVQEYYERMGLAVVSVMAGDGRVGDIKRAHGASFLWEARWPAPDRPGHGRRDHLQHRMFESLRLRPGDSRVS